MFLTNKCITILKRLKASNMEMLLKYWTAEYVTGGPLRFLCSVGHSVC